MGDRSTGAFVSDKVLGIIAVIAIAAGAWWASNSAAEKAVKLPAPAFEAAVAGTQETAVFAGGCFWGVQAVFQHTAGVLNAVSGYAGGAKETANYTMVSTGQTGHAEAVQVTYDPRRFPTASCCRSSFRWRTIRHSSTGRGPTSGTQYRSALFWRDAGQKQVAERYIAQLEAATRFPRQDRDAAWPRSAPSTRPRTITRTTPPCIPNRRTSWPSMRPRSPISNS